MARPVNATMHNNYMVGDGSIEDLAGLSGSMVTTKNAAKFKKQSPQKAAPSA